MSQYRSAGALGCHTRIREGFPRDLPINAAWRGTGPRPTVKTAVLDTVARGPVPRDLSTFAENARSPETPDSCCSDRCMARDRPSPYGEEKASGRPQHGEGQALALRGGGRFSTQNPSRYRSAGACPPRSQHGAGNPLACACGMRGPKPYGKVNVYQTLCTSTKI